MSLLAQCPAKEVRAATGFHADQFNAQVCGVVQQLLSRKHFAHHNFAAQIKTNQMKDCFAEINADRV